MDLPENAKFDLMPGEEQHIEAALKALEKDPHADREILVRVRLHIHNEFPRAVYKGKMVMNVADEAALEQARQRGYSLDAPVPVAEEQE